MRIDQLLLYFLPYDNFTLLRASVTIYNTGLKNKTNQIECEFLAEIFHIQD